MNRCKYQCFYKYFPEIVLSVTTQLLSWTHYEKLDTDEDIAKYSVLHGNEQLWSMGSHCPLYIGLQGGFIMKGWMKEESF